MNRLKIFLATGFYAGFIPVAPGTAGTLVGLIIYVIIHFFLPEQAVKINIALVLISIYPSIKIGDFAENFFARKDPPQVVLDEILGIWISLMFHPFSWAGVTAAFFIFRIMDIIKPFPANGLQKLKGGAGIMIDDYIAGVYTNICVTALIYFNIIT
jgi:phosphatidylglycerophosphatase A